jgi:hypothetical protein
VDYPFADRLYRGAADITLERVGDLLDYQLPGLLGQA